MQIVIEIECIHGCGWYGAHTTHKTVPNNLQVLWTSNDIAFALIDLLRT